MAANRSGQSGPLNYLLTMCANRDSTPVRARMRAGGERSFIQTIYWLRVNANVVSYGRMKAFFTYDVVNVVGVLTPVGIGSLVYRRAAGCRVDLRAKH